LIIVVGPTARFQPRRHTILSRRRLQTVLGSVKIMEIRDV
jgi:hypothetical protein